MTKPFPALCKECKWSVAENDREWNVNCVHPKVNACDPYALGGGPGRIYGTGCVEERKRIGLFAKCGMKGKLWEPKDE